MIFVAQVRNADFSWVMPMAVMRQCLHAEMCKPRAAKSRVTNYCSEFERIQSSVTVDQVSGPVLLHGVWISSSSCKARRSMRRQFRQVIVRQFPQVQG